MRSAVCDFEFKVYGCALATCGLPGSTLQVTQRVHIHSYYGIRVPKTIVGMVFGDLIP